MTTAAAPFPTTYVQETRVSDSIPNSVVRTAPGRAAASHYRAKHVSATTNMPVGIWLQPQGLRVYVSSPPVPTTTHQSLPVDEKLPARKNIDVFPLTIIPDAPPEFARRPRSPRINGVAIKVFGSSPLLQPTSELPRYLQYIQGSRDPFRAYERLGAPRLPC